MKRMALFVVLAVLAVLVMLCACTTTKITRPMVGSDKQVIKDAGGNTIYETVEMDYNGSIVEINKVRAENPRSVKIKLSPIDPTKPSVFSNIDMAAEVPLDSWQQAVVPESIGKQVGSVLEKATPIGLGYVIVDGVKTIVNNGGTRTNTVSQTTNGEQNKVSAPGGNDGTGTFTTDTHAVDNHSTTTGP